MAKHYRDLLSVGRTLLVSPPETTGPLSDAYIRRSISTTYYAVFHCALDSCAIAIVGESDALRQRRRIFMRSVSHRGLKLALSKVSGRAPARDVVELFQLTGAIDIETPDFIREYSATFREAHDKRRQADYDLNIELTAPDAMLLSLRAETAILAWDDVDSPDDLDFKRALCLLIALNGKLRGDGD